jgi:hypothetical protein
MVDIPPIIPKVFSQFADTKCWCFCNAEKIPVQFKNPERRAEWVKHPELAIITLSELIQFSPLHTGFGIFTSKEFGIGCLDFDHFLKDGEPVFNNRLDEFLNITSTFVEVSQSGNGVHAFYFFEPNNDNVKEFPISLKKFGISLSVAEMDKLDKDAPNGKWYCNRHFIKLTGRIYKDNDGKIFYLTPHEYGGFEKAVTTQKPVPKKTSFQSSIGMGRPWADILSEGGITHVEATDYVGKVSPQSRKLCIEAWKIPCPNRNNHKTRRPGDISADLAILSKYEDGSSSCKCNHHSCAPESKPNLLQKLWFEIKQPQVEIGKEALKRLGVNTD